MMECFIIVYKPTDEGIRVARLLHDTRTRAAHPTETLAEFYGPDLIPPNLRRAHQALDCAVDWLHRLGGFASEHERAEHLFMLYEKMRAPLEAARQNRDDGRADREEDHMEVKEAVQIAKDYIIELFEEERIVDVGLEEVDFDQSGNWVVTIGFSRSWNRNVGSVLGGQAARSYKAVRIQDKDGKVLSVKDRTLLGDLG
jgi:hypothetical protein